MWEWYLGIFSICTKFEADLCVFLVKFTKTRKLNQTFAYNDTTADHIVQTEITQISDVERRTSNVKHQASEAVNSSVASMHLCYLWLAWLA